VSPVGASSALCRFGRHPQVPVRCQGFVPCSLQAGRGSCVANRAIGGLHSARPVQCTYLWQGRVPFNPKPIIFPKIIGFTGKSPAQGVSGNGFTDLALPCAAGPFLLLPFALQGPSGAHSVQSIRPPLLSSHSPRLLSRASLYVEKAEALASSLWRWVYRPTR
jgi:hypothetical protein